MTVAIEDENDLRVLRGAWEDTLGTPPDKYLSKRIMVKALAWHSQCAASGGLSPDGRFLFVLIDDRRGSKLVQYHVGYVQ